MAYRQRFFFRRKNSVFKKIVGKDGFKNKVFLQAAKTLFLKR
jgi:hypothetical protein